MLNAAFYVLLVAVLIGALLAVMHFANASNARADAAKAEKPPTSKKLPPWPLAALHAVFALGGFGLLLMALRGPPHGLGQGTAAFGSIAATLFVVAALFGGGLLAARWRRRIPNTTLIGLHAMIAITGFVILMAYVFS
ncbi:MAG: hypothetical protein P8Z80_20185 [Pseudolabrys sp.]|jgi:hypothetical protein